MVAFEIGNMLRERERMIKITRISIQKRNKSRYNLFIDRGQGEEFAFSVDENTLIKYRLKKGLELESNQIMELMEEEEKRKVYHDALRYLSFRMRSIYEMKTYLEKKGHDDTFIAKTITRLLNEKLLDDRAFAKAFVLTKKNTTTKGPILIQQELREKGVKEELIEEALLHYSFEEQQEKIKRWIEKQQQKKEAKRAFLDKLRVQLVRKGFSHDVISETMNEIDFSFEDEKEWEAIQFHGNKIARKYEERYNNWEFEQKVKQALYRKGFSFELIERFLEERVR